MLRLASRLRQNYAPLPQRRNCIVPCARRAFGQRSFLFPPQEVGMCRPSLKLIRVLCVISWLKPNDRVPLMMLSVYRETLRRCFRILSSRVHTHTHTRARAYRERGGRKGGREEGRFLTKNSVFASPCFLFCFSFQACRLI